MAIPDRMPAASEGGVSMMVFTTASSDGGAGNAMSWNRNLCRAGGAVVPNSDGLDGAMPVAHDRVPHQLGRSA